MSTSKASIDKDRQWFSETFAKASQLESRIVPDILDGKEGPAREASFPFAVGEGDETMVATAFGLTLSAWSGDTKACFGFTPGDAPESPVYLEWTSGQPLKEILNGVKVQMEGAREHTSYSYADGAAELELDQAIRLEGPESPVTKDLPDGAFVLFRWSKDKMTVRYRPDRYSEGILKQFTDSLAACLGSMKKAKTVRDLAFATKEQIAEVEGFTPAPVDVDIDKTIVDLFRENAAARPDKAAVIYKGTLLTNAQLDALTDRIAAHIAGIVKPGGVVSIIIGRNEYDYWSLALPMKRILEIKMDKVNNGFYGDFHEFDLFVFTKEDLDLDQIKQTIAFMQEKQAFQNRFYSRLFLSQIQTLFDCDLETGRYRKYKVNQEQRRAFYEESIMV